MRFDTFTLAVGILLFLQSPWTSAFGEVVTLQPSADTSLFEPRPEHNLGASELAAGTTAENLKSRALIRFNLAGRIPPTATIQSVTLTLQVTKAPPSAVPSIFGMHRVLQAWGEGEKSGLIGSPATSGEATWRARSSPSTSWNQPGGASPSDFTAKASASRIIAGPGNYTFATSADLVGDVQAWITDPASNFGWILISQSEGISRTARRLGSKESPGSAPALTVDFSVPISVSPPQIALQPQSLTVAAGSVALFSVGLSDSTSARFQWRFQGTDVVGATNASLTLNNVQLDQAGAYQVVVSNAGGAVTSDPATLTVLTPPVITQQPSSQTVTVGANVSLTVVATGGAPLSYQWRLNGSDLAGATNATLVLSNVQTAGAGVYQVVVSNPAGSVTSDPATLTVLTPPVITQQPLSQTVTVGANVTMTTVATGGAPLGYQWKLNGSDLAGATNATLALSNVQTAAAGVYQVVVSNPAGSVTSEPATLSVLTPPLITQQPLSQTVTVGASVTLTVVAAGGAPLGYQWKLNGSDLAGATNATLALSNIQPAAAGVYQVVVNNPAGSVTSEPATLTVLTPPLITQAPLSQTATVGANVTLTVVATGGAPLSYQWRLNGSDLAGATNATLALSNVQPAAAGVYQVVVNNPAGSMTSDPATLTVLTPPFITQQPLSQTVTVGAKVVFTVVATGSTPLSYQWKLNGSDLVGATNASLTFAQVQTADGGVYSVSVRNEAGGVISSDATLSIIVPADVPPRIDSIGFDGRNVLLQFTVEPTYQLSLEFSDSVPSTQWTTLTNLSAPLAPLKITVPDAVTGSKRFYRLTVTGRIR